MTRQLEEFFNLPPTTSAVKAQDIPALSELEQIETVMKGIDKIEEALPMVKNLETADREMDHLASLAEEKFQELMDLGMSVEPRFSGTILQTAGVLLGHAITAKQAKIDKKLRMIDLQLKKLRLDQTQQKNEKLAPTMDGSAVVVDRNTLLKQLIDANKPQKSS